MFTKELKLNYAMQSPRKEMDHTTYFIRTLRLRFCQKLRKYYKCILSVNSFVHIDYKNKIM